VEGQAPRYTWANSGEEAGQNIKIDWVRLGGNQNNYSIEFVQGGRWRVKISNVPGRIQGEAEGQDIKRQDIPRRIQGRRRAKNQDSLDSSGRNQV